MTEDKVPQHASRETAKSGWTSIEANHEHQVGGADLEAQGPLRRETANDDYTADPVQREAAPLFALSEQFPAPFPERFPRLTFLAISLLLLISALTAEFEYLRGAGYYWP